MNKTHFFKLIGIGCASVLKTNLYLQLLPLASLSIYRAHSKNQVYTKSYKTSQLRILRMQPIQHCGRFQCHSIFDPTHKGHMQASEQLEHLGQDSWCRFKPY